MIILGPALVILGIGFLCWLLFTLAVFALPVYVGLTVCLCAVHTGAGALDGIVAALVGGGATFDIGQLALAFAPWAWLRLLIVFAYAVPGTMAGYSATHGIARMAMPSPTWQAIFAVFGATAVGITAFIRIIGPDRPDRAWGASTKPKFSATRALSSSHVQPAPQHA
jgi:hypothetical protein